MADAAIRSLASWLVKQGLAGASERDLLHGFCAGCINAGIELSRAMIIIDTLHPVYEGRAFRWRNDGVEETVVVEYGRTVEGPAALAWQNSVFYHLLTEGISEILCALSGDGPHFHQYENLREEGHHHLFAMTNDFGREGTIGEMDCMYSYWCTRNPDGFDEHSLDALRRLVPFLALAVKSASLARIAGTLVEVYLGRDAGQRVLDGRIERGVAERINAVIWFSDLRGYSRIVDSAPSEEIIPLLNDYSDAVISAVHDAGGDVLKLIGDGILAIFKAEDAAEACNRALQAERDLRGRLAELQRQRHADGRPTTTVYIGLHIGEVLYGNVGSADRLDFTVVGPAVNEASRIASMCRSADRDVLLSSEFVAAASPNLDGFASVGRYAFRGVSRPRELFTLDPELPPFLLS